MSGKLKKGYPRLEDEGMAERVVEAVRSAFEDRESGAGEECFSAGPDKAQGDWKKTALMAVQVAGFFMPEN